MLLNNSSLNSGSQTTPAGTVGRINIDSDSDSDREFVLFNGTNTRTGLDLNANLGANEQVNEFTASMTLDMIANNGTFGNRQPDGVSFNLGKVDSASFTPGSAEYGVKTGLSVRLIGYNGGVRTAPGAFEIVWNGTVVATTALPISAITGAAAKFDISVAKDGAVSASWGNLRVSGKIPNSEWQKTSQEGWDYLLAGRTGGNGGTAWVDDLSVDSSIVCFARGTLIDTSRGPVLVQDLRAGDLVRTLDRGLRPLRWIGARHLDAARLAADPALRPVRIRKGALGEGMPEADLLVSPQHRVMIRSRMAERMFGATEVLVAACQLLDIDGVEIAADTPNVEYWHFLFDGHEIVSANGAFAESLHTGPLALQALGAAARAEIFAIFPELHDRPAQRSLARPPLSGREGRKLARSHARHKRALVI